MVQYHKFEIDLSPAQVKKLAKGHRVRISKHSLGTGHLYYLTKVQYNRLKGRFIKGQGAELMMSAPQLKHNIKEGGNLLESLRELGTRLKPHAQKLSKKLRPEASRLAKSSLMKLAEELPPELLPFAEELINYGIETANEHFEREGWGMKPLEGGSIKSWFQDKIIDPIKSTYKKVAPKVIKFAKSDTAKFLSKKARPIATKAISAGIKTGLTAGLTALGAPELAPVVVPLASIGVDAGLKKLNSMAEEKGYGLQFQGRGGLYGSGAVGGTGGLYV